MPDPVATHQHPAGLETGQVVRIPLAGQQTLQGATALKQDLLQALARQTAVEVDLGNVETIDTAALQLILAARSSAAAAGQHVTVTCPASNIAAKQMLALGFTDFIDPSIARGATGQTIHEG